MTVQFAKGVVLAILHKIERPEQLLSTCDSIVRACSKTAY